MNESKLETVTKLFEGTEIRSVWDSKREDYYFSVVDVIKVLTGSPRARKYWSALKNKLNKEGSELSFNVGQLKLTSQKDGKKYMTDVLDTKGIFRLIESVPSPKAEPFKMWLASLGKERIDDVFDPEKAINRGIEYYLNHGYSEDWIERRLKANKIVAQAGGEIASNTRKEIEKKLGKKIINNENNLDIKYIEEKTQNETSR